MGIYKRFRPWGVTMSGNAMKKLQKYILLGGALLFWANIGIAADGASASTGTTDSGVSREQIKGLDEQVQDIKEDVLSISAELTQLEEKLLYPSNTQVSVFVSFDDNVNFPLESLMIKIDGKEVASHIYSFKELQALRAGGVQRLYTGNVRTGEHTVEVAMVSKAAGTETIKGTATGKFAKAVKPALVEIHLGGPSSIGFRD